MKILHFITLRILMLSFAEPQQLDAALDAGPSNLYEIDRQIKYLNGSFCDPTTNSKHFMCNLLFGPEETCTNFKLFAITSNMKRRILASYNNLRNLKVKSFDRDTADKNVLHWDDDLGEMAKQRIYRCGDAAIDDYFILNVTYPVANITFFMKGFPGNEKWLPAAIHTWYKYLTVNKPPPYSGNVTFVTSTQLIRKSKFVGCAGARVNNGTKFICYYDGPYLDQTKIVANNFQNGSRCTQCEANRSTCSLLFSGLCSLNLFSGSNGNQPNSYLIFLLPIIFLIVISTRAYYKYSMRV